ncbi:MAG TPA: pyridoxamine 5'-phosphate oxidase family protein [Burkholderiaceae bacterium]
MTNQSQLQPKFWELLQTERTVMLGLFGERESHTRPMTAQVEGASGPIWFFTAKDTELVRHLITNNRAAFTFASKGHDLFAAVRGTLSINTDRAVVDRLWSPLVAAWYRGKDDPNLVLLRLDVEDGEIWLNESGLAAGVKMRLS